MSENCKYCQVELPRSHKPRKTFACRKCKHKHYRELYPERYRESVRKHFHANREKYRQRYYDWKNNNPESYERRWKKAHRTLSSRHSHGKTKAKKYGQEWLITLEQHAELLKQPCHYCGGDLNPTGCGLDRMDNSKGYLPDNVVPCCKACNRIKGELLTHDEMLVAMEAVIRLRQKRRLRLVLPST